MDPSNPLRALAPGVEGDVLAALVRTRAPLSGARVGDLAGRSHTQVREVLRRLEQQGLVLSEHHGNSYTYLLNRRHVLAEAVESMAGALDRLEQGIGEVVSRWRLPPVGVVLFGSFARRDGHSDSDVDLLVVRPAPVEEEDGTWVEQRYDLARQVEWWTGNRAQIIELSEAELVEAVGRNEPLVESLRSDGIVVVGHPSLFEERSEIRTR